MPNSEVSVGSALVAARTSQNFSPADSRQHTFRAARKVCCLESAGEKFCEVRAATKALPTETSLLGIYLHGLPYTFAIGHIPSQFAVYYALGNQRREVTTRVSRLEQTLNKPKVVLIVGVVAVALNVLLYFGYFLPRMTPLIAH